MEQYNLSEAFLNSLTADQQEQLQKDNDTSFESFIQQRQAKEREAAKAAEHLQTLLV